MQYNICMGNMGGYIHSCLRGSGKSRLPAVWVTLICFSIAARSLWTGSTMKDPLSPQIGELRAAEVPQIGQLVKRKVVAQSLSPLPGGLPERRQTK